MFFFVIFFIFLVFIVLFVIIYFLSFIKDSQQSTDIFLPIIVNIDKDKKTFSLNSDRLFFKKDKKYVLSNFYELFTNNVLTIKFVVENYDDISKIPNLHLNIQTDIKLKDNNLKKCYFKIVNVTKTTAIAVVIWKNIYNYQEQTPPKESFIQELPLKINNYFNFSNFIYNIYSKKEKFHFLINFKKKHQYITIGIIQIENLFTYVFHHDLKMTYITTFIQRLIKYLHSSFGTDTIIFFSSINEIIVYKLHLKSRWDLKKMDIKFNNLIFRNIYLFNSFSDIKVNSGFYIYKKGEKEKNISNASLDLFFKYAKIATLLSKYNQCSFYTLFDSQDKYLNTFLKTFSFSASKASNFLKIEFLSIANKNNLFGYLLQTIDQPETRFLSINYWNKSVEKFFFNIPTKTTSYHLQIIRYKILKISHKIKTESLDHHKNGLDKPIYFIKISFDVLVDNLIAIFDLLKINNVLTRVSMFITNLFFPNPFKLFHIIQFLKEKNIMFSFCANIFNREQLNLILANKPQAIFVDSYMTKKILKNIYFLNRFRIFVNDCCLNSISLIFKKHSYIADIFYQTITKLSITEPSNDKNVLQYYFIGEFSKKDKKVI